MLSRIVEPACIQRLGYFADRTSARIFSASFGLTAQVESLMRHWAIVMPQPQPQGSSFSRFSASVFCSAVSTDRSTPGISVARALLRAPLPCRPARTPPRRPLAAWRALASRARSAHGRIWPMCFCIIFRSGPTMNVVGSGVNAGKCRRQFRGLRNDRVIDLVVGDESRHMRTRLVLG